MSDAASPDAVPAETLAAWLADHVPGATGRLRVTQLAGGSSNLTFRVRDDANDWVLRRPPLGRVLATAHDVGREFRVQRALAPTGVPVPAMVAACDDPSVIGAPFYLMAMVDGIVYADSDSVAHLSTDDARDASHELVDVLARLHAVDADVIGLGDLGAADGFLVRQVDRWCRQWDASKTDQMAAIDEVASRLRAVVHSVARASGAGVVHGDYSFNNTMYARSEPARLVAVLDWEMATLGDPLTDLGMLVTYWGEVGEVLWRDRKAQAHRASEGFPSADALVERYARASGRDVDHVDFYRALATFKLAVIVAGARARLVASGASPERVASTAATIDALADAALAQSSRLSDAPR